MPYVPVETFIETYVSLLWISLAIAVFVFMWRWTDHSQMEWHCYITIYIAFFCSAGIICLCPPDLALALEARSEPDGDIADHYDTYSKEHLYTLYKLCFWPCFALNVILTVQEYYVTSGYFDFLSRIKDTLSRLGRIAALLFILFLILLGVVSNSGAGHNTLKVTLMSLANIYGLFIIVFLMGYGLVEFPKFLFFAGDDENRKEQMRMRIAVTMSDQEMTSIMMTTAVANAQKTLEELKRTRGDVDLIAAVEKVLSHCPEDALSQSSSSVGEVAKDKEGKVTIDSIALMHQRIIKGTGNYRAAQGRIERLKQEYWRLEDITRSYYRADGVQKIQWSFGKPESSVWMWKWHVEYKPWVFKFLALCAAVMSSTILLGELSMMSGQDNHASAWSEAVHSDTEHVGAIVMSTMVPLTFEVFLVMWALFQMRITGMMVIVPKQQTSPKSMSFAARRLVGMAPPLVYNHLGIVFESSFFTEDDDLAHRYRPAFSRLYGEMDTSAVGDFNTFFPFMILCVCLLQSANAFNRLLIWGKMPQYQFGETTATEAAVLKAEQKLKREHDRLERNVARDQREMRRNEDSTGSKTRRKSLAMQAINIVEDQIQPKRQSVHAPESKSGWIEKKAPPRAVTVNSVVKGSKWAKRYFVIKDPGFLQYWRSEEKAKAGAQANGTIDLRLAMSVKMHTHSSTGFKDACRVNIELADRTFKLRFADSEICQGWLDSLIEWRDYSIDHAALMPTHHFYEDEDNIAPPTPQGPDAGGADAEEPPPPPDAGVAMSATTTLLSSATSASAGGAAAEDAPPPPHQPSLEPLSSSYHPAPLEGWLKKKATGSTKHWYDQWQERYFRVIPEDRALKYFKNAEDMDAKGSIDLRELVDVDVHKSSRDVEDRSRFDLDLGEKRMRVKAETPAEAAKWIKGISEWRDHFLLNM